MIHMTLLGHNINVNKKNIFFSNNEVQYAQKFKVII